jgi:lactoylglutathione lyase
MPLNVRTYGIILGTERFDECVAFYRDIVGLSVWFEKPGLVCFRFGNCYLMVETGGVAHNGRKPQSGNPTMLRFNVDDVESGVESLRHKGIPVELKFFEWGTVGTFLDPDGNACELKNANDSDFQ